MDNSEKIQYVKKVFDQFLKDQNIYDAWYERYRLDNAMYEDEIPIENFLSNMIEKGERGIHNIFYSGIQGTCMTSKEGDDFIAKNKQCDILSNSDMIDADGKWMDNWKSLIDLKKLGI